MVPCSRQEQHHSTACLLAQTGHHNTTCPLQANLMELLGGFDLWGHKMLVLHLCCCIQEADTGHMLTGLLITQPSWPRSHYRCLDDYRLMTIQAHLSDIIHH